MAINKKADTVDTSVVNQGNIGNENVQQPQSNKRGLMGVVSAFSGAASRGLTGEAIKQYYDALQVRCKEAAGYALTIFDKNVQSTLVSGIIVSYTIRQTTGKDLVTAILLLLENTAGRLPSRQLNINGQVFEIPSVLSDAFNAGVRGKVQSVLAVNNSNADIRVIGAMSVPDDIATTNDAAIQRLWSYAAEACAASANMATGFLLREKFTVTDFYETDRFSALIDQYTPGVNSNSIPVRSDLAIRVVGSSGLNTSADPFNTNQKPIVTVDTFVDLAYEPPKQALPGQVQSTQCITPIVTITKISSELGEENLELRLLALASATVLAQQYAWASSLNPRTNRSLLEVRDIGALGYEIPTLTGGKQGVKIDTRSAQWDDTKYADLIHHAIRPNLFFRMHIEECGEMSWLDTVFYQASMPGERGARAKQAIINAMNRLTGNKFSEKFTGGEMFYDEKTRIPLGYYVDGRQGNSRRPLTDIGYLELLTLLGATDLQYVTNFDTRMANKELTIDQRYREHLDMLDRVLQGEYKLKGSAYSIMVDNTFLSACVAALTAAGWTLDPKNINVNLGPVQARGASRFDGRGTGLAASDVSGMYRSGDNNTNTRGGLPNGMGWGVLGSNT